jgi:hypothetical protein
MLEVDEIAGGVVKSVDCRQTLCRLVLDTKDMAPLWRLEQTLRKQDTYPYERRLVPLDGGGASVEVMLARDGQEARYFPRWKDAR